MRKGAPDGSWLARMLARKTKMLVAVALANRMARTAWALLHKGEDYRDPAMAAAEALVVAVSPDVRGVRERKVKRSRDRVGQTSIAEQAAWSAGKRTGRDLPICRQARGA